MLLTPWQYNARSQDKDEAAHDTWRSGVHLFASDSQSLLPAAPPPSKNYGRWFFCSWSRDGHKAFIYIACSHVLFTQPITGAQCVQWTLARGHRTLFIGSQPPHFPVRQTNQENKSKEIISVMVGLDVKILLASCCGLFMLLRWPEESIVGPHGTWFHVVPRKMPALINIPIFPLLRFLKSQLSPPSPWLRLFFYVFPRFRSAWLLCAS